MRIRSTVSALGKALALALVLTTAVTPTFAEHSQYQPTKTPMGTDTNGTPSRAVPTAMATPTPTIVDASTSSLTSAPASTGPAIDTASVRSHSELAASGSTVVDTAAVRPRIDPGTPLPHVSVPGGSQRPQPTPVSPVLDALSARPTFEQARPGTSVEAVGSPSRVASGPDVRVAYLGAAASGVNIAYRFTVESLGPGTASNVQLRSRIAQRQNGDTFGTVSESTHGVIVALAPGQAQEITVICAPSAGYHCTGATLEAAVYGDLDPNDNSAHS